MPLRPSLARTALALGLAGGLAACAAPPRSSISAQDYSAMQTALRDSAEARGELQKVCTSNLIRKSPAEREMMAAFLDVEPAQLDRVFCERVIAGIARKEITYQDFVNMNSRQADPETIRRFMRALRRNPDELMV